MSAERKEIKAKRAKVQDTCGDIARYLQRINQDKKLMQDFMASANSTPRGRASSGRSSHDSQVSGSVLLAEDQLRDLKAGRIGGDRPETKYLNKKRDLVRKLVKEKAEAVERGVKAKI